MWGSEVNYLRIRHSNESILNTEINVELHKRQKICERIYKAAGELFLRMRLDDEATEQVLQSFVDVEQDEIMIMHNKPEEDE